jgi:hypothetical protein
MYRLGALQSFDYFEFALAEVKYLRVESGFLFHL